ncbi:MAG: hypothetical protein KC475_04045 [Cyanobacteria bacterium HKST-UBA03]|nr:hypothetical protein [Cyanobacteria bacterium HKST-UBA03]
MAKQQMKDFVMPHFKIGGGGGGGGGMLKKLAGGQKGQKGQQAQGGQQGQQAQGGQQKDDMVKIPKEEYTQLKMKAQQGGLGQG